MTANVVPPAELERMLEARLQEARTVHRATRRAKSSTPRRPKRRARHAIVAAAILALTATAVFADAGSLDVIVADRTGYEVDTTDDGAIVEYIGDQNTTFGSAGTGTFGTFLQTQDNPSEEGYNTDGDTEFDTGSSPNFNRAVLASAIPLVPCESLDATESSPGLCWELFADINDSNANDPEAAQIQLTELEIWLTDDNEITGYDQGGTGFGTDADLAYDFEGNILINDVNQGSGRGDLRYLVPLDQLESPIPAECFFGSTTCTTYFIVYTEWGDPGDGEFSSDSGFEEWKVRTIDLATKSGVKFNDLDADGAAREAGEPGLAGWTIYADYDNDSVLDLGEPFAVTGAGGTYTIPGIIPGTWNVREVAQANWTCSFPNPCVYNEVFAEGADLTGNDFGNFTTASKSGTKFHDLDADGAAREAGEPGLAGWTIYVDYDNDSVLDANEPSAVTAADGTYTITGINPGTWNVREVAQANWTCSFPAGCVHNEVFASGAALTGNDFGNFTTASKSGTKFHDLDADGAAREAGEPGLAGWTIYVDYDNDSVLDANEPSAVTAADGTYTITGINPGTWNVREVAQANWTCSFPAGCVHNEVFASGAALTGNDFGNFTTASKSGTKFHDLDADGAAREAGEPGLAGWTIYVDYDNDSVLDANEPSAVTAADGTYTITGINPGTWNVREVAQANWTCSFPAGCVHNEVFASGAALTGNDFGNWTAATKTGFKFNDADGGADWDAGELGLAGWTINIYNDVDGNSLLSAGDTLEATTQTADGTGALDLGEYEFADLDPGDYIVCEVLQATWIQTFPTGNTVCAFDAALGGAGYAITLTSGQVDDGNNFGNMQPPLEGCTPGFWKTHTERWDGVGGDDLTTNYQTTDLFNATFGVTSGQSGVADTVTLLDALKLKGGGPIALIRHAAAALLNTDSDVDFGMTSAEVIALFQDAVGAIVGPETVQSALATLSAANERGCPFGANSTAPSRSLAGFDPLAIATLLVAADVIRRRRTRSV